MFRASRRAGTRAVKWPLGDKTFVAVSLEVRPGVFYGPVPMGRFSVAIAAFFLMAAGCGSSSTTAVDTDADVIDSGTFVAADSGFGTDADPTPTLDGGRPDGGRPDGGTTPFDGGRPDGGPAADAGGTDAGVTCHSLSFGQPSSLFFVVPASQFGTLTGGTIVDGLYDLVGVETSTSASASFTMRATWRFSGSTLDQLDQLTTSAAGPIVNRSGTISKSGANLTRSYTCGSTDSTPSTMTYDSKMVGGFQTVRVQSGTLRLTLEKRP